MVTAMSSRQGVKGHLSMTKTGKQSPGKVSMGVCGQWQSSSQEGLGDKTSHGWISGAWAASAGSQWGQGVNKGGLKPILVRSRQAQGPSPSPDGFPGC